MRYVACLLNVNVFKLFKTLLNLIIKSLAPIYSSTKTFEHDFEND